MNSKIRYKQTALGQLVFILLLPAILTNCTSVRLNIEPNQDRNTFTLQDNLAQKGERTSVFTNKQDAQLLGKVTIRQHLTEHAPQTLQIQIRKGSGFYSAETPLYEAKKTRLSLSLTKQKDYGMIAGFRFSFRF